MTSRRAFLQAFLDQPEDDVSRLVLADWLEDHATSPDEQARVALLRLQVELASWVPDLDRRVSLLQEEQQLVRRYRKTWLGPLDDFCEAVSFDRGLAEVTLDARALAQAQVRRHGDAWLQDAWVQTLRLTSAEDLLSAADARSCPPALGVVPALVLDGCQLGDASLRTLASWCTRGRGRLGALRRLSLANNSLTDQSLLDLCGSSLLEHLNSLDLRNNALSAPALGSFLRACEGAPLRWIDLQGNEVDEAVTEALLALLERHAPTDQVGRPFERLVSSVGMQFVRIPPGTFLMGSPESEKYRLTDESPVHTVTLTRPFSLGAFQVTQRQLSLVLGENPSHFSAANQGGPDHPVDSITYEMAEEFCRRLSSLPAERKAGRTYRLPTEAEWEYACRAGLLPSAYTVGHSLSSRQANFDGRSPGGTARRGPYVGHPVRVGSYPPNRWGVYDMHGNVWEWCADWFDPHYYERSPGEDPEGPPRGPRRVVRGGSWFSNGSYCRTACRGNGAGVDHLHNGGFRVVMTCTASG